VGTDEADRNAVPLEMLVFNVNDIASGGEVLTQAKAEEMRGFHIPSSEQN
jgi:hypothetical protein